MAVKDIRPLKPTPNWELLNRIKNDASPDYQARIPNATKAGIQDTLNQLTKYRPHYNEFLDSLVNRIGLVVARNNSWTNPLAQFKRGLLTYGDTIEEIQSGLISARTYDPDRESLEKDIFGTYRVDVEANFHTVNRQNYYPITVNTPLLNRAFLDPNGLTTFVNQLMEAPMTSDQWDEYLLMRQLLPEYASNGGFFKVNVPNIATLQGSETDAQTILKTARALAGRLQFMSTHYNAAHMPVSAKPEDMILISTPEFQAAIDVDALAGAFNIDRAEMATRTVLVDDFGITGAQAILTTKDFFVVADQQFETTSAWNPVALQNNYFLHHWQVISASRFVPAILFWTGPGDVVPVTITPVTSVETITITDRDGNVPTSVTRGELYSLFTQSDTTPAGGPNDGVRWALTGNTSNHTYITRYGVLHVGGDEGGTLSVTATSTWRNADNIMQDGITSAALSLTVSGVVVPNWPVSKLITSITIAGAAVSPTFAVGTTSYTATVPHAHGDIVAKDVKVVGPDQGEILTTIAAPSAEPPVTGTTQVVSIGSPESPGDPVYTVTVTFS
jgi:hypothetical protein